MNQPIEPGDPRDPHSHMPDGGEAGGRFTGRGILAWTVLLVLVAGVVTMQGMRSAAPKPGALPDPSKVSSPMLKMLGRLAIGMERYTSGSASTQQMVEREQRKILVQMDDAAAGIIEQMRIVPLAGWFVGTDEALARLGAVELELSQLSPLEPALEQDASALRTVLTTGSDALSTQERDELLKRHGWFAEVALTLDSPDNDPRRLEFQRQGFAAVMTLVGAGITILLAGLAGFVLLVVMLVKIDSPWMRRRYLLDRHLAGRELTPYAETLAIFLAGFVLVQLIGHLVLRLTKVDVSYVLMWSLLGVALWPLARGVSRERLFRALGWHRGQGVMKEVLCGVVGYLAGLPLVALSFVVSFILIALFKSKPTHPVMDELANPTVWKILAMYSLASLWAPIVEETMFRGAFHHHLRGRLPAVLAAVVSGLVFAIIHPQGITLVPPLMMLGVVFALIREWRGSLIGPMVAHAMHNGFLVTMMVLVMG